MNKMKFTNKAFCLVLFFFLTVFSHAQNNDELETVVDELYTAMVDKDKSVLKKLTADKLTYGHSSGTLEDKSQFIEAVMNGSFDYISITPEDQKIIISGDVALVRHIFVTKALNEGKPIDIRIGNLMTFQKLNGIWKLLARQAYKL